MPIYKESQLDESDDFFRVKAKPRRFSLSSRLKLAKFRPSRSHSRTCYEQLAILSSGHLTDPNSKYDIVSASAFNIHNGSPMKYGNEFDCIEERIDTRFGPLLVARQGARLDLRRPIILTYHDLGLNYIANFEGFLTLSENCSLLSSFTVVHINAPYQEAKKLSSTTDYPTMDELSLMIIDVLDHYKIKSFVGIGCGLGANVLTRFALLYPTFVEGLFLINPYVSQSSWREWFWTKRNIHSLASTSTQTLPPSTQEYLLWYHFGNWRHRTNFSRDTIDIFRSFYNSGNLNPHNLSLLMDTFVKRSSLRLSRGPGGRTLKCQTLLITGTQSPHLRETILMNSRLDPKSTTWLKIDDCGMVLEERPHKVAQALHLFLQGLGYPLKDMVLRRARLTGISLPSIMATSMASIQSLTSAPSSPVSPTGTQLFFPN